MTRWCAPYFCQRHRGCNLISSLSDPQERVACVLPLATETCPNIEDDSLLGARIGAADNPGPRASSTHAGRRLRVKTSMASELACEPLSDPPCSPRAIDSAPDSVPCPSTLTDSMSQSVRHLLPVMKARPVLEPQFLTRQATQHHCLNASDPRVGAGN